jgi:hypothetical protein
MNIINNRAAEIIDYEVSGYVNNFNENKKKVNNNSKSINNLKTNRIMLKERLASICAGSILNEIRTSGRLTMISDECGINRKFFNRKAFRLLRFHRLVNLLYSLSSWQTREEFIRLGSRLFEAIWDFCSLYDDEYYDETRR